MPAGFETNVRVCALAEPPCSSLPARLSLPIHRFPPWDHRGWPIYRRGGKKASTNRSKWGVWRVRSFQTNGRANL